VSSPKEDKAKWKLSDPLNRHAGKDSTVDDKIRREESERNLTTSDLAGAGDQKHREQPPSAINTEARRVEIKTPGTQSGTPNPSPGPGGAAGAATPGAGTAGAATATAPEQDRSPLFSADEARELRGKWDGVQVGFVDEPRQAVEEADRLVAATMKRLAEVFAEERQKLEHQWDRGDNVSTEDLRLALRRYRSFFGRLLSV
jgi:hypothetical protein